MCVYLYPSRIFAKWIALGKERKFFYLKFRLSDILLAERTNHFQILSLALFNLHSCKVDKDCISLITGWFF